jgi:hypothetical protein
MTVTLIVMEPGGAWPGHVGGSEDIVAVSYAKEALLERTRERLYALRRGGKEVRLAVLACNEASDGDAVMRRSEVAHELLAAVSATGFGRLILSSGDPAPMPLRRELLSLAGALSQRLRGTTTTVSVRFGKGLGRARLRESPPQQDAAASSEDRASTASLGLIKALVG